MVSAYVKKEASKAFYGLLARVIDLNSRHAH
jgi:hypothetical protein